MSIYSAPTITNRIGTQQPTQLNNYGANRPFMQASPWNGNTDLTGAHGWTPEWAIGHGQPLTTGQVRALYSPTNPWGIHTAADGNPINIAWNNNPLGQDNISAPRDHRPSLQQPTGLLGNLQQAPAYQPYYQPPQAQAQAQVQPIQSNSIQPYGATSQAASSVTPDYTGQQARQLYRAAKSGFQELYQNNDYGIKKLPDQSQNMTAGLLGGLMTDPKQAFEQQFGMGNQALNQFNNSSSWSPYTSGLIANALRNPKQGTGWLSGGLMANLINPFGQFS